MDNNVRDSRRWERFSSLSDRLGCIYGRKTAVKAAEEQKETKAKK